MITKLFGDMRLSGYTDNISKANLNVSAELGRSKCCVVVIMSQLFMYKIVEVIKF